MKNIKRLKREKYLGYVLFIILLFCIIVNIILNKSWDFFLFPITGIAFVIYGLTVLNEAEKALLEFEKLREKWMGEFINDKRTTANNR